MAILLASAGGASAALADTPVHYVSIVHEIDVARSSAQVWARIGHYCDLSKWLGKSCRIVTGRDGEIGATRLVDNQISEILVGKTATSYSYAQRDQTDSPTRFYHGTLDVEPLGAHSARIIYTLFYDNGRISAPTARAKEVADRSALFAKAVSTMKSLAEAAPTSP